MRLAEILEDNRVIMVLYGLEEDYTAQYEQMLPVFQMFKKLKGIRLQNYTDAHITPFRKILQTFIDTEFYPDPDIDALKAKYEKMLQTLQ